MYTLMVFKGTVDDHCVFLNAINGIIIDSANTFPMKRSSDILKQCGGSDVEIIMVGDIKVALNQTKKKDEIEVI